MVFVADDAFPLKTYLMKPHRSRDLSKEEHIYNYRLSRARRVVENAFGILAARFLVLSNTMLLDPKNAKKVTLACCILHNVLRSQSTTSKNYISNHVDSENLNTGEVVMGNWRSESVEMLPLETGKAHNRSSNDATRVRDSLQIYFNTIRSVLFQNNIFN